MSNYSVDYNIIEKVNNTFSISPHFERHENFAGNIHNLGCAQVQLEIPELQCSFIKSSHCQEIMKFIDYLSFIYCAASSSVMQYMFLLILFAWGGYLFIVLGETADKFFCPALMVISKIFGLSENLAGVTLLAFGNGSPDIFTAIANPTGDTELMFAELLGAVGFVVAVIAGAIIIIRPFRVHAFSILRDVLFLMLACLVVAYSIDDLIYTIEEAIITFLIYIFYLFVVIVDHVATKNENTFTESETTFNRRRSVYLNTSEPQNAWKQFLSSIQIIDAEKWKESGFFNKTLSVIRAPAQLALLLIIPIVDYSEDRNGWSKLLNIFHCITLPQFGLFSTGYITVMVYGIPLAAIVCIVSLVLAIIIYYTSEVYTQPSYHNYFAIGSFIGSILVITMVASEIVALLETFGIVMTLSHSMLGMTALAWGNSIGDLIANITLARNGHHQMGFSACFGGPMFNTLIGFSATFFARLIIEQSRGTYVREGPLGDNCSILLNILFFSILITFSFTNFQARKSLGFMQITIYLIFLLFAFLSEFEVIHSFGTDHYDEGIVKK